MNEDTYKVLYEGLEVGTRRYVANLMQNYLSDPGTHQSFARGLERAAETHEKAVEILDEIPVDRKVT